MAKAPLIVTSGSLSSKEEKSGKRAPISCAEVMVSSWSSNVFVYSTTLLHQSSKPFMYVILLVKPSATASVNSA